MSNDSIKTGISLAATCALAAAATGMFWKPRHALPEGVAGGAAGVLHRQIVYAGGTTWREGKKIWLSVSRVYDPERDVWLDGPALPEPVAYGPVITSPHGIEILGGINGEGPSRNVWRLSSPSAHWEQVATLSFPSALAAAALVNGNVHVFGGCPDIVNLANCANTVMTRDGKGNWHKSSEFPDGAVALAASAVVGEHVYLFGGCQATGPSSIRNLTNVWRYSPANQTWKAMRPLPQAARSISAIALDGGAILLTGGYFATAEEAQQHPPEYGFSSASWLYYPDRDQYEPAAPMVQGIAGIALVRYGKSVWGMGGEDRARSRSQMVLEMMFH